jgi:putative transposase
VATMLRTVFDQPDAEAVRVRFDRMVAAIATKYPDAAERPADAREDLLAFAVFPGRSGSRSGPITHRSG